MKDRKIGGKPGNKGMRILDEGPKPVNFMDYQKPQYLDMVFVKENIRELYRKEIAWVNGKRRW